MDEPVLFVDDEPHLLDGVARALRSRFRIHTATSGAEGLQVLQQAGPFAVVVSDMRMPEMNGVQFLSRVRDLYPDTVRMILSGQSDLAATIASVNEGNIFRFLSKPCPTQHLIAAVGVGVEQYRLVMSEKVLLEQTLSGAVSMLIEMLGLVTPAAYGRAQRLKQYVGALSSALQLREHWAWGLAALLSQIGCVSLPKETLSKIEANQALTEEERSLYESLPQLACRMLHAIPRLEDVAAIVGAQNAPLKTLAISKSATAWDIRTAGIVLLRTASAFDYEMAKGRNSAAAAEAIHTSESSLPQFLIEALKTLVPANRERVVRTVRLLDLAPGMLLDEPLITHKGACLVPAGHEVTAGLLLRLKSIAAGVQLKEPFRVQVPV
ncbi:MAG: HD domain-containing phosphohydrolase [Steroidobacteraceae bacterium]